MKKELASIIVNESDSFVSAVTITNVIWGYHEKELKVLLQRLPGLERWILPLGLMKKTESTEGAAERIVRLRTGLDQLFLKQFQVFSLPGRTKDENFTPEILKLITEETIPAEHWIYDPKIAIGYYALTEFSKVTIHTNEHVAECKWWDVDKLPSMLFNHEYIIAESRRALRQQLFFYPIGLELLEDQFTLPEIFTLYQTILGRKLDVRNFIKKLLHVGVLKKSNEKRRAGAHRPAFLYAFNRDKYHKALEDGISLL